MKKQKQSLLINYWEDYEFYLYLPDSITRNNNAFVFFYYFNPINGKKERIKKFVGKNRDNCSKIKGEAKKLVSELIQLLANNWNPLSNDYNETSLTPQSSIADCIQYWLKSKEIADQNNALGAKRQQILVLII